MDFLISLVLHLVVRHLDNRQITNKTDTLAGRVINGKPSMKHVRMYLRFILIRKSRLYPAIFIIRFYCSSSAFNKVLKWCFVPPISSACWDLWLRVKEIFPLVEHLRLLEVISSRMIHWLAGIPDKQFMLLHWSKLFSPHCVESLYCESRPLWVMTCYIDDSPAAPINQVKV